MRAASLAARLQQDLGIEAELTPGPTGRLTVEVDGEVVAEREAGFFKKLLGGGWPDPDRVVDAVRARCPTT